MNTGKQAEQKTPNPDVKGRPIFYQAPFSYLFYSPSFILRPLVSSAYIDA